MNVFQTSNGDVLVTMHKRQAPEKAEQTDLGTYQDQVLLEESTGPSKSRDRE